MSDFNDKTVDRLGDLNARLKRLELFEDETLLRYLSDEQRASVGLFRFRGFRAPDVNLDGSGTVYVFGKVMPQIKTLGQLRHLIAALGGDVK